VLFAPLAEQLYYYIRTQFYVKLYVDQEVKGSKIRVYLQNVEICNEKYEFHADTVKPASLFLMLYLCNAVVY